MLFDLDGTLIDSIELILASHRHATLTVLGESPPDDVLRRGIGTPLVAQMRTLDDTRVDELVAAYRAFNHANHDALLRPYEGLLELCTRLHGDGVVLGRRHLEVAAGRRDGRSRRSTSRRCSTSS